MDGVRRELEVVGGEDKRGQKQLDRAFLSWCEDIKYNIECMYSQFNQPTLDTLSVLPNPGAPVIPIMLGNGSRCVILM